MSQLYSVSVMPVRSRDRQRARPNLTPVAAAVWAMFCVSSHVVAQEAAEKTLPRVDVIGDSQNALKLPGSATVIDAATLEESRVFNVNEALRKVPGVHVREEEGVGLRPNIGIRGMNPTRSTKTLLLEDGLPLSFAPYGDNASYYHPPIDRYESIEVSKGSQVIRFGPQTAGGLINYITPEPQQKLGGTVGIAGGNRGYLNGHVMVTGNGAIADFYHKESDGARENMRSRLDDVNFKWAGKLNDDHKLVLRATHFREYSQLTYAGLTQAEFQANARQNPFKNDYYDANRTGMSATHEWRLNADQRWVTSVYGAYFDRDWWRQASSTADCRVNPSANDFTLSTLANCKVDGRLRAYTTVGMDSRFFQKHSVLGLQHDLEFGVKLQSETQKRRQEQYSTYANFVSRSGMSLIENQDRRADAMSAFASNRTQVNERLAVTPIVRIEHIKYERNIFTNGTSGSSNFTEFVPGIGATYQLDGNAQLYGGVHKGFSPPRVEDAIGGTGGSVNLNAESSVNAELGLRSSPTKNLSFDMAVFRNDFSNLVQVGSIAGGSTAYSEGKALFQGFELAGQADRLTGAVEGNLFARLAMTWLPTAEQKSAFSSTAGTGAVGKRLPYAPEQLITLTLGYRAPQNWNTRLDYVYVGRQFADFDNTPTPSVNGQEGLIESYGIWNTVANYTVGKTTFFIAGKNLSDKTYIVDRTRGIQVGMPRTVQIGMKYAF